MAAQGSGATNPFTAGTPSYPGSPASAASAMPVPQMLEVIGNMMNAVHAQSSSLKEAVENLNNRTSSGPSLSKLLQRPEIFRPKDREEELTLWYEWAWTFKQWMLAVSPEIHASLEEIEKDLSSVCIEETMTDDAISQGKQLYAILTTMLRERPLQLLKSIPGNNGYEAWRVLHTTLAPTSKTRALALLGAISQYPNMSQGNLLEQLLKMEDLFKKYEQAASKPVPEEVKSALLLRVLPQNVKSHLTVSINDESTYDQMREVVLRWERSSQKWSSQIVTGVSNPKAPYHDDGGLAPMDVDRVKGKWDKGKGKYNSGYKGGKGKDSKGKGKGYSDNKGGGKYGGGKPWNKGGKPKGGKEGKGKEFSWGKGEKGKKGKGQGGGKLHPEACRICGKHGHWGNECWMKDKVRNVNDSSSSSSSITSPAPSTTSSAAPSSVKRVFNLAENDLHNVPLTTVYEMESDTSEVYSVAASDWWCRMVQCYDLCMDDGEQEVIECPLSAYEVHDLTMFDAYKADQDWVSSAQVRGVKQRNRACASSLVEGSFHQVVLDSGADLSVMPRAWLEAGVGVRNEGGLSVRMMDAQGGIMPNFGSRCVTLDLGQACVQEVFHASDVDAPLLSLGRLLKKGWSLAHRNNMLHLCNDEEEVEIPVSFMRNSLVVDAQVFAVQDRGDPEPEEEEAKVQALDQPRIIAQTTYNIHAQGPDWEFLECGDPCVLTRGKARYDPSAMLGIHLWKYRTTLAFRSGEWELIDYEEPLEGLKSLSEPITQAEEEQIPIFTVMHRNKGHDPERYGMEFFAVNPKKQVDEKGESDPVFSSFFGPDPDDEEVIDLPGVELPGVAVHDEPKPVLGPSQALVLLPGNSDDHVDVEGVRLGPDSSARELRAGCQRLGLGMSGSKNVLYRRLLSHSKKRALEDSLALEHAAKPYEHQPKGEAAPDQPTPEQVAEHELTHIPFKKWCSFCVSCRSRRDAHRQGKERHDSEGGDPIIAFDFFYVDVGGEELDFLKEKPAEKDVLTILIVVDKTTGMCRAIPLPSKGDESLVHGAKEVLGFIAYLGYQGVGIRGDNEPSAVALTKMICQARSKLGLKTVDKPCQPYEHPTNGAAEQAVQGIRDLGTTLLEQLKAKSGAELRTSDDLVGWCYVHASMLHNAFAVHAGTTPFEKAFNMNYQGKLACFGEVVFFALNQSHVRKGKPKFVKGIWLGKTLSNDLNVCGTALGIYLSGTIRRMPPNQQWSKHMIKEFQGKPYRYALSTFGKVVVPGIKDRKKPEAIEAIPMPPALPPTRKADRSLPSDEAGSDPVTTPRSATQATSSKHSSLLSDLVRTDRSGGSGGAGIGSDLSYAPSQEVPEGEASQHEPAEVMEVDAARGEKRTAPIPALTPLGAPPMYAGTAPAAKSSKISSVTVAGEELYSLDEHLDLNFPLGDDFEMYMEDDDYEEENFLESWHGRAENVGPPELTEEQLHEVEEASKIKEVTRLVSMGVLEQVETLPQGAELLQTKHVLDWRFREDQWQRRARLVCKQLKIWDPNRTDVYAPSTSPSTSKLLPALMVSRPNWKMQSFDVKDAFLTVRQRDELYVLLEGVPYRVHYCLPGQQPAAAWWAEQLTDDLKESGLVPDAACPAAFGKPGMGSTIHVDDGLMAGEAETLEQVASILKSKYKLELSDVACDVGDMVKFLKKEMVITDIGVEVRVSSKYLEKICATLDLKRTRTRKTPCNAEISQPDYSEELGEDMASRYRGAVGSFLYLSPDRPDCQWSIAHLARSMSRPTWKMYKQACHLAEYLLCTTDVCQVLRWTFPGRSCLDDRVLSKGEAIALQKEHRDEHDLLESVSDSDWAGHHDRVSSSCGHIFFNGNPVFCFVRKQGAISLSSCEAELIACCSTAAEALYLQHIIQTLSSAPCRVVCRLDSSSARSLLQKRGVSKVRHLDTKLLWLQRAANEKRVAFGPISTHLNTSDIGTKVLSSERYGFLMVRLGYKGFSTTLRDQVKLDRMHGKVLRLLVLMDAMKGVTGEENVMVNEYEPNTSGSFNLEGMHLHIESVLSFYLPTWFLLLMIMVGVCFVAWVVKEIGANRVYGHGGGGYVLDAVVRDKGDDHECEDQNQSDGESEQCDVDGVPLFEQPKGQGDDQPEVVQQRHVHDAGEYEHGVGRPENQVDEARDGERYDPTRHGWNPQIQHAAQPPAFPDLKFCPNHGQVYHQPGCGCLRAATSIITYKAEDHQRLHLAPCGQCRPQVLPGSNPPVMRRRKVRH